MTRHWYAEYNPYGLGCSYDSIGWCLYAFDSRAQRDEWVAGKNAPHWHGDVARAVTAHNKDWHIGTLNSHGFYQEFNMVRPGVWLYGGSPRG